MRQLEPRGAARRVLEALALLVGIAYGAHLVVIWLTPIIPLVVSVAVLIAVYTLVLGRRR